MKVEKSYYVRGIKVPSLEHYMRIRKMDEDFDEELVKEIFKKDVPEATPQEEVVKAWRAAKPYTPQEFIKEFHGNSEILMVCFSISDPEEVLKTMDSKLVSEQTIIKNQKRTFVTDEKMRMSGAKPMEKLNSDSFEEKMVEYEDTYKLHRIDKGQLGTAEDVTILEAVCPSTDRHFFLFVDTNDEQCQTAIGAVAWTLRDEEGNPLTEEEYRAIEQES